MTILSSDDNHEFDVHGDFYETSSSTQVNVKEDQHQPIIADDKTSHHKMGLQLARTKRHNFNVYNWGVRTDDHPLHIQLCEAATRGDWKTAKNIEKTHKGILSEVIRKDRKETALHIATKFNNTAFVERLIEKLTEKELEATDVYGNTALCMAATLGAVDIANSMLQKNKDLVLIRGSQNATPILVAARYKQNHMVAYLLKEMDLSIQSMATSDQMELLLSAIATDHYDVTLLILNENKSLALERDTNDDTPLHIMARKSNTLGTKNNPTKWQSSLHRCFKYIYKKKMMQIQACQTVELMWSVVQDKIEEDKSLDFILHPSSMLHDAASVGNVEFMRVLLHTNPEFLRIVDSSGKNIFHIAVENRQRRVFDLIYDMKLFDPVDFLYYFNEENISLLELAAKRADSSHLERVLGSFFQMHEELLWFKEVEDIVERRIRIKKGNQTARELFNQEHTELAKEGEKWVKSAANSSMRAAISIAIIVLFAGGMNYGSGSPTFVDNKWVTVFVISDAIALISSSFATLLFWLMQRSRCEESDFLLWLPLELVVGIGSLFLSLLAMVLAFDAYLFLLLGTYICSITLLIGGTFSGLIFLFCVLQWELLTDCFAAIYAGGMSYLSNNRLVKGF